MSLRVVTNEGCWGPGPRHDPGVDDGGGEVPVPPTVPEPTIVGSGFPDGLGCGVTGRDGTTVEADDTLPRSPPSVDFNEFTVVLPVENPDATRQELSRGTVKCPEGRVVGPL